MELQLFSAILRGSSAKPARAKLLQSVHDYNPTRPLPENAWKPANQCFARMPKMTREWIVQSPGPCTCVRHWRYLSRHTVLFLAHWRSSLPVHPPLTPHTLATCSASPVYSLLFWLGVRHSEVRHRR